MGKIKGGQAVRLADTLFRRGHLSEKALAEICMTGSRPVHLDRCEPCASRAVELGRWLDEIRVLGLEAADETFPAERLAAQQTQIMRRLEQIDRPARVIAFPGQSRYGQLEGSGRGIRPGWVAVAAAAGLVIGVFGTQFTTRLTGPAGLTRTPTHIEQTPAPVAAVQTASASYEPPPASLMDLDENDRVRVPAFEALEDMTPSVIQASQHVIQRNGSGGGR
jgi:hypothetical protein